MTLTFILNIIFGLALIYLGIDNFRLYKKVSRIQKSIVTISDTKPSDKSAQAWAMQLGNEIRPYITEDGKNIAIKVVKPY